MTNAWFPQTNIGWMPFRDKSPEGIKALKTFYTPKH